MKWNPGSIVLLVFTTVLSGVTFAQTKAQARDIVVNGQNGKADVIDQNGRLFVDLFALANIGKGSLSFGGPGIVLTLPGANGAVGPTQQPAAATTPANPSALSREFMKASIEEISSLREWATTLGSAIRGGYNVTDAWVNGYRDQASQSLQLADASATTDGDRNAAQLLHQGFALVQQWSDKLVAAKQSMDTAQYTTSPDALRNDPLSQKIIACGHFLTRMLGSGTFQDDGTCN
jgi:hypothetical protein